MGLLVKAGEPELALEIAALSEPLLQVVRVAVLGLSLVIAINIWRGNTYYPRWLVLGAPLVLMVYIFILFALIPSLGNYLLPATLNVAHSLFFAASTYFAYQAKK